MNFFKKIFTSPEAVKPESRPAEHEANVKTKNYNVTGISHYESNILKLAQKNPLYDLSKKEIAARKIYDKDIFEYIFSPQKTELVPEPMNPHDPNAIKVMVGGYLVGYIKAGACSKILKLINENKISSIESKISGGNYKMYWNDGTSLQVEKGKKSYSVKISISEK